MVATKLQFLAIIMFERLYIYQSRCEFNPCTCVFRFLDTVLIQNCIYPFSLRITIKT